jgi:hypothetical protein
MFTLLYLLLELSSFCLPLCFAFCVPFATLPLFRFSLPSGDLFDLPFGWRLGLLSPAAVAVVPAQWQSVAKRAARGRNYPPGLAQARSMLLSGRLAICRPGKVAGPSQ